MQVATDMKYLQVLFFVVVMLLLYVIRVVDGQSDLRL